jgi:hypothetical protein
LITITVRPVQDNTYRPSQLMIEIGLGKTQFVKWVKALSLSPEGERKHFYTEEERIELVRFRSLVTRFGTLSAAFECWQSEPR